MSHENENQTPPAAVQLPKYFTGAQFTSRIGTDERKLAENFLQTFFPKGDYPKESRPFLNETMKLALKLSGKLNGGINESRIKYLEEEKSRILQSNSEQAVSIINLQKQVKELTEELEIAKAPGWYSTESPAPDFAAFETDFTIFERIPQLLFFKDFYKPAEHKTIWDVFFFYRKEAEWNIAITHMQPLRILENEEYDFLKKWHEETVVPGLRTLLNMPDLPITGRHVFMLMLDYCYADPMGEIPAIFPGITTEQLERCENLRFPRPSAVQQVLKDIKENADEAAKNVTDAEQTTVLEETTEQGRVVALNGNNAAATTTQPAADNAGGD